MTVASRLRSIRNQNVLGSVGKVEIRNGVTSYKASASPYKASALSMKPQRIAKVPDPILSS